MKVAGAANIAKPTASLSGRPVKAVVNALSRGAAIASALALAAGPEQADNQTSAAIATVETILSDGGGFLCAADVIATPII